MVQMWSISYNSYLDQPDSATAEHETDFGIKDKNKTCLFTYCFSLRSSAERSRETSLSALRSSSLVLHILTTHKSSTYIFNKQWKLLYGTIAQFIHHTWPHRHAPQQTAQPDEASLA